MFNDLKNFINVYYKIILFAIVLVFALTLVLVYINPIVETLSEIYDGIEVTPFG